MIDHTHPDPVHQPSPDRPVDPIDVASVVWHVEHTSTEVVVPAVGQVWATLHNHGGRHGYHWIGAVFVRRDDSPRTRSVGRLLLALVPVVARDDGWSTTSADSRHWSHKRWDHFVVEALTTPDGPPPWRWHVASNVDGIVAPTPWLAS